MKRITNLLLFLLTWQSFSASAASGSYMADEYTTVVTFPASYVVGDYIEFVRLVPISASSSGYYEVSIAYTRNNVAAAATHIVSVMHAAPDVWREAGVVNTNKYVGADYNITVDCNTQDGMSRLRLRAVGTSGDGQLPVNVKVRSINFNHSWVALNNSGNDLTVNRLLPMTGQWDLVVGNVYDPAGGALAIRAISNGYVGIGTGSPTERLSVNGKIRAQEIKVESQNWPDYVFGAGYKLPALKVIEQHIKEQGHLPGMPSAKEVRANGVNLGELNRKLLEKVEELTLHLINKEKEINELRARIQKLEKSKP